MSDKTCTKCGAAKFPDEFSRDKTRKDGRFPQCKECTRSDNRARYKANPEPWLAASKKWRAENAERDAELHAKRHQERMASDPSYRERRRENQIAWRRENPEKSRNLAREWQMKNPEKVWVMRYEQRARILGLEPFVERFTRPDVIERYGDACFYCGGEFYHLDHALPISRGGSHTLDNVRPACAPCNQTKSDRTPEEWKLIEGSPALFTAGGEGA